MADGTPLRLSFNPFEVEEFATSLPIFSTLLTGAMIGSWVHWLLVVAYIFVIGYLINIYFGKGEEAQFFRAMEKQGQMKEKLNTLTLGILMLVHYFVIIEVGIVNVPWAIFMITALVGLNKVGQMSVLEDALKANNQDPKEFKKQFYRKPESNKTSQQKTNKKPNSSHSDFDEF